MSEKQGILLSFGDVVRVGYARSGQMRWSNPGVITEPHEKSLFVAEIVTVWGKEGLTTSGTESGRVELLPDKRWTPARVARAVIYAHIRVSGDGLSDESIKHRIAERDRLTAEFTREWGEVAAGDQFCTHNRSSSRFWPLKE